MLYVYRNPLSSSFSGLWGREIPPIGQTPVLQLPAILEYLDHPHFAVSLSPFCNVDRVLTIVVRCTVISDDQAPDGAVPFDYSELTRAKTKFENKSYSEPPATLAPPPPRPIKKNKVGWVGRQKKAQTTELDDQPSDYLLSTRPRNMRLAATDMVMLTWK